MTAGGLCAILLDDLDVHPRVIMRVLRHTDQAVTMKIYAKAARTRPVRRSGSSARASPEGVRATNDLPGWARAPAARGALPGAAIEYPLRYFAGVPGPG